MIPEQHIALLQKIADDLGQRIGLGFDGLLNEIEEALADLRKEAEDAA